MGTFYEFIFWLFTHSTCASASYGHWSTLCWTAAAKPSRYGFEKSRSERTNERMKKKLEKLQLGSHQLIK